MARTRNDDREVRSAQGKLGNAVLKGDEQAEREARHELHQAKIHAAAKALAAQLAEEDVAPETIDRVRALLAGA